MSKLRQKIRNIDNNIQNSIRGQSVTDASSETLKDAQAVSELLVVVESVCGNLLSNF